MFKFISQFKRPVLVVKAYKTDRDGDIKQEPVYVRFEDNVYTTDQEEIAKFIRKLKNFGSDYFEVNEIPADKGYQGNQVKIYNLDKQEEPQESAKVEMLERKVNELSGSVGKLTSVLESFLTSQNKPAEESMPEVKEEKTKKEKKK